MTNSDDDQQQHLRELLEIHTRNARSLEKQIAQFGIEPPLKLINSLDYEQRAQRAIERALDGFELRRADTSSGQAHGCPSCWRVAPLVDDS